MVSIVEVNGDIFSILDQVDPEPEPVNLENYNLALCHCVSQDLKMGRGIAVEFRKRFGQIEELHSQQKQVGQVATIWYNKVTIFYLITKQLYYEKPTYESLAQSLRDMKVLIDKLNIHKLAMPRIGCGLDRLDWDQVKPIILDIFKESKIEMIVYSI